MFASSPSKSIKDIREYHVLWFAIWVTFGIWERMTRRRRAWGWYPEYSGDSDGGMIKLAFIKTIKSREWVSLLIARAGGPPDLASSCTFRPLTRLLTLSYLLLPESGSSQDSKCSLLVLFAPHCISIISLPLLCHKLIINDILPIFSSTVVPLILSSTLSFDLISWKEHTDTVTDSDTFQWLLDDHKDETFTTR